MINWLVQHQADCPPAPTFLAPAELARLAGLKIPKRRDDWLLGRWAAKRLLQSYLAQVGDAPPLAALVVNAAADGAPQVSLADDQAALSLSISHSGANAFCALSSVPGLVVGADIERIEPRADAFARDYFTTAELELVAAAPATAQTTLVTAIWSAKEAALKATRHGLTVDTRRVECLVRWNVNAHTGWQAIALRADEALTGGASLRGWWQIQAGYVLTIVAAERP